MYFNTSYLFESCCSNAPHCLSSSPQVAMILEEQTRFIYFYITAHTSINITLNSYQSPLMAKKNTPTWQSSGKPSNPQWTPQKWACPLTCTSSWLIEAWQKSLTRTWERKRESARERSWPVGCVFVSVCKRSKCVYDSYLLKSARRALMSPHTPRPSVNFTQRSTAAAAKPNTFWTECVSSNTQSRTSPRS